MTFPALEGGIFRVKGQQIMETPSFADGLGRRVPLQGPAGERLESLRLCSEIAERPATQAALVERAARLADFHHPSFARVRRIERLGGLGTGLALVSDAPLGMRLSDVLRQAQRRGVEPDTNAALYLTQQAVSALAALHAHSRDASHGAIGPERIVVLPDGGAVVVEYVLGSAIEQLQLSRSQLWALFRVPAPSVAGSVRFDQQTDVIQLGVLALALLLGRVLLRDEFPQRLPGLLEEAATLDACQERRGGLSRPVRAWVARALQLDSRSAFRNAIEAEAALAAAVAEDRVCRPSAAAVQSLLSQCSLEQISAGTAAERRDPPSGAVVTIPPRPDTTTRVRPHVERVLDRGSGAHRVSLSGPEADPTSVEVLADLSSAPARESASPAKLPASAPAPVSRSSRGSARPTDGAWAALRRALRVGLVVFGLVLLFGVSFLGARAYLRLPGASQPRGKLVVESRPAGLELLVDGEPSGYTPATLSLPAGHHTLALRNSLGVTLVPVTVVAGAEKLERVEVRQRPRSSRRR